MTVQWCYIKNSTGLPNKCQTLILRHYYTALVAPQLKRHWMTDQFPLKYHKPLPSIAGDKPCRQFKGVEIPEYLQHSRVLAC